MTCSRLPCSTLSSQHLVENGMSLSCLCVKARERDARIPSPVAAHDFKQVKPSAVEPGSIYHSHPTVLGPADRLGSSNRPESGAVEH